jgi:aminoglycoside phosphotransferase (APT) family kinase protein
MQSSDARRSRRIDEDACEQNLDVEARVDLLVGVCEAVRHAHQKGVIHRDLEPSNIFVDEAGRPCVLDSGIARASDPDLNLPTIRTQAHQIVGTLVIIREREPASLGSVRRDLRGDIETIVMKALAKEPDRRYAWTVALAELRAPQGRGSERARRSA